MAVFLPSTLKTLERGFSKAFEAGYGSSDPVADKISRTISGNQRGYTFGFKAQLGYLHRWVGEKRLNDVIVHSVDADSEEYELTVEVARKDIETDTLGMIGPEFENLGKSAALWRDFLATDVYTDISGTGAGTLSRTQEGDLTFQGYGLCFDGQPLFSTAHTWDGGTTTQSNKFSGRVLSKANVSYIVEQMKRLTDEGGKKMGVRPDTLMVPIDLEVDALEIVEPTIAINSAATAAGVTNLKFFTSLNLVVNDLLSDAEVYYLLDMSKPGAAPVMIYERIAPRQFQLTDGSDHAFKTGKFQYSVEASGIGVPACWWLAARGDARAV